jgi:hypothetical protein
MSVREVGATQLTRSDESVKVVSMLAITMAYDVIDGVFVVVHAKTDPSDQEWDKYLEFHLEKALKCTQTLVVTAGGGPNAKQRAKTNQNLKDTVVSVAVCTDATIVSGIVTALSWFNPQIKRFPDSGVGDALAYLKVSRKAAETIKLRLPAMRLKIAP